MDTESQREWRGTKGPEEKEASWSIFNVFKLRAPLRVFSWIYMMFLYDLRFTNLWVVFLYSVCEGREVSTIAISCPEVSWNKFCYSKESGDQDFGLFFIGIWVIYWLGHGKKRGWIEEKGLEREIKKSYRVVPNLLAKYFAFVWDDNGTCGWSNTKKRRAIAVGGGGDRFNWQDLPVGGLVLLFGSKLWSRDTAKGWDVQKFWKKSSILRYTIAFLFEIFFLLFNGS